MKRHFIEGLLYRKVTCSNNHEFAIIAANANAISCNDITHPKLQHLKNGDTIDSCPDCDSREIRYKKPELILN